MRSYIDIKVERKIYQCLYPGRSLTHSMRTAEAFYQSPTLKDVYNTYTSISNLISGETGGEEGKGVGGGSSVGLGSKRMGDQGPSARPKKRLEEPQNVQEDVFRSYNGSDLWPSGYTMD